MFRTITYSVLLIPFYLIFYQAGILAQEMKSEKYTIEGSNFNISSGISVSDNFRLTDLVGNAQAQIFTAKGFYRQSGFKNSAASSAFTFSISPLSLNFDKPTPGKPQEKTLQLNISNSNLIGFNITAEQNQPLITSGGTEIPDTLCNGAFNKICTSNQASAWTINRAYGFGYRISGDSKPADFKKSTYYRPLPSRSKKESPQIVLSSENRNASEGAEMIFKLNFSPKQPAGIYNNVVHFTAIPGI